LKSIRNRCLFDKPNVGELAKLIGVEKLEMEEVNAAAKIIAKGGAEIVVSLGPQGISYQRFL
jgi:6-phosphofructokinase 2